MKNVLFNRRYSGLFYSCKKETGNGGKAQFDAGLIDEARVLRDRFDPTLPAFSAIGYRESWAVLDGELSLEAAIDLDARRNVAFAKRQRTWFRAEPGIELARRDRGPARSQHALDLARRSIDQPATVR